MPLDFARTLTGQGARFVLPAESYRVYQAHARAALDADIVVTNHAMLARQAIAIGMPILENEPTEGGRPLGAVIVDECDRFPSAAASAVSELVPLNGFLAAVRAWDAKHKDMRGKAAELALEALHTEMTQIRANQATLEGQEFNMLWGDMPNGMRSRIMQHLENVGKALAPLMTAQANPDDAEESDVRGYAHGLANFYRAVSQIVGKNQIAQVAALRWSPTRHYPSLRLFRLYPARLLKSIWSTWTASASDKDVEAELHDRTNLFPGSDDGKKIKPKARALILTSATVSAPTKADKPDIVQMSDAYGIYGPNNACNEMNQRGKVFTPKRFGSVSIVFSDPGAPAVFLDQTEEDESGESVLQINPEWVKYNTRIAAAASSAGGRVLVLANSYRATRALAQSMFDAGLPVIEKRPDISVQSCIRRLVNDPQGIFVTPGSWEGFDISRMTGPDGKPSKIKHVVMTQIPFSRADGGHGAAMMAELQRRGIAETKAHNILFAQATGDAARKAKQGFGRGIRGPEDAFTFWIGDPRFPRTTVFQTMMRNNPNVRTLSVFANIIPRRFRVNPLGPSAWDSGDVLSVDGKRLTKADVLDLASGGSTKKAA
jgi:Rad3-related DNA helicase